MKKVFVVILGLLVVLGIFLFLYRAKIQSQFFRPNEISVEEGKLALSAQEPKVIVEGLTIPWELVFLSNGDMLITERSGNLLRIGAEKTVIEVPGVNHRGEGGLLGLALHPKFSENKWVYLYLTSAGGGTPVNRVERYVFNGTALSERSVIIDAIPGAPYHDGGRIAFGPDGLLYVATGDAGVDTNAQNIKNLAGKILRVTDDGSVPGDNPFGNAVYSYGHRNVQGIAWDASGQLWATEHGRSGIATGYDELNKIIKGGNYGWPEIQGDAEQKGMIVPQLNSGPTETWAPGGLLYVSGHAIFPGLRGESLYVADISNGTARDLKRYFRGEYGRLRTIVRGPDGMLYLLTSNKDGRGVPVSGDDRIITIDPKTLGF